jgi:hypothetical protein
MTSAQRLNEWIEAEIAELRLALPNDLEPAVHALLNARRTVPDDDAHNRRTVSGLPLTHPGLGVALQLLLGVDQDAAIEPDEEWASSFLTACNAIATARLLHLHTETGFIKLDESSDGAIDAWIATKRAPVRWRELAAWTRWAAWNNGLAEVERPADSSLFFSYQFGYPPESSLFGSKASDWTHIVGKLFELAESASADPVSVTESGLVGYLAERLKVKPDDIAERLPLFILDAQNAGWHASLPGLAAAPLIRVGEDNLVISPHGVWMAPLMFLTREMRRRDSTRYNNAAHAREDLFRRELYALFPESRFVTARNRVLLRKPEGEARTDIDAAIFDKKTGTLAIFELKALDPFARSTAELIRQRDSTLEAGHQVSAILDWMNRHSPDELLKRIDPGTAKKFNVQKVLPFVLGRCVALFDDGPAPEARAAWSDWPAFVPHVEAIAETNATNPLASLHQRVLQVAPTEIDQNAFSTYEFRLARTHRTVRVFPSRSALAANHPT